MKRISLILLSIVLLSCLFSCKDNEPEESDCEWKLYHASDIETFYIDLYLSQTDSKQKEEYKETLYLGEGGIDRVMLVPHSVSETLEFGYIEAYANSFCYFFHTYTQDASGTEIKREMTVNVAKNEECALMWLESEELTMTEGVAYDEYHNTWIVDVNGTCVKIRLLNNIILESADEIYEYFTFEEIPVSELEKYVK